MAKKPLLERNWSTYGPRQESPNRYPKPCPKCGNVPQVLRNIVDFMDKDDRKDPYSRYKWRVIDQCGTHSGWGNTRSEVIYLYHGAIDTYKEPDIISSKPRNSWWRKLLFGWNDG